MTEAFKPIAYGHGEGTGRPYHPECWHLMSIRYKQETGCQPYLGTLFYPGAQNEQLKGKACLHCGFNFETDPVLKIKPTGHVENGWQFHF